MSRLTQLLEAAERRQIIPEWIEGSARVADSYAALSTYVKKRPESQIYGFNTLSGHRDDHVLDEATAIAFQQELIESHVISDSEPYDERITRVITATKLQQLSLGGATLSQPLYTALLGAFEDPGFMPSVPRQSSYSCGDVIPAAHWAKSVLSRLSAIGQPYRLQRGEGMALINGSFIHLGYAAALARPLATLWAMQMDAVKSDLALGRVDSSMLAYAQLSRTGLSAAIIDYLEGRDAPEEGPQWPVSFRAIPETLALLHTTFREYFDEIEKGLAVPSGNPLVATDRDGPKTYSQASFMLPQLAVRTSSVLEALLFSASADLGRIKWLLSGHVDGIPADGQTSRDDVAFIQWPKLMQAMVEDLRMLLGRSLYASGGDTSFGIEDLWTNGVSNLDRLSQAIDLSQRILALGLRLKARIAKRFGRSMGLDSSVMALAIQGVDAAAEARTLVDHYQGSAAASLRSMVLT